MKSRLRPYTEFLVRQNLSFLIAALVLVLATAAIGLYLNHQVSGINARIKSAKSEIEGLLAKRATLRTVVGESTENLDQDLRLMTTLIPDSEDYFSIINALETLSGQTGFRVVSYTINLLASTSNRLSLTVTGTGDSTAFLNFLNNYQINGGRLITAEHIGIEPSETGSLRLDLNFYNKKVSTDLSSASAAFVPSLAELNDIKSKVTFSLTGPTDQAVQDYPTKPDPF